MDILALKKWFALYKRKFPWREAPSPYRVWVSEMMLQQTRAICVIPYFERWMERFPRIDLLAEASEEEVVKLWEGLGYYSRARNLLRGAQEIVKKFPNSFPSCFEDLLQIPGIGPYSAGAICAFAFKQPIAAIDGNAIRVLARHFFLTDDVSQTKTKKTIQNLAEQLLPKDEPWVVTEALIELGATLCCKKPLCTCCPLQRTCQAYLQKKTTEIPISPKKISLTSLSRTVALFHHGESFLVKDPEKGKVMEGLYEFPYQTWESTKDPLSIESLLNTFSLLVLFSVKLPIQQHSFTHYKVRLYPYYLRIDRKKSFAGYRWISKNQLEQLPFSSGHRRIIKDLLSQSLPKHIENLQEVERPLS